MVLSLSSLYVRHVGERYDALVALLPKSYQIPHLLWQNLPGPMASARHKGEKDMNGKANLSFSA